MSAMTCPMGAVLLCLAGATQAQPVVYRLDPAASAVHFEVLHFGASTTRGRFSGLQGEVTLDRSAHLGKVSVRIPTAAISMGVPVFDARMRQADLLDSAGFPEAYFVASRLLFEREQLREVRGELTVRGVGRPLSLRALAFGCRSGGQAEVCGGDFEGELLRSDFGITFGQPFVADRVRLRVQVEGSRQ